MSRHLMAKMRQAAGEPPRGYGPPPKVDWRHGWVIPSRAEEIDSFNTHVSPEDPVSIDDYSTGIVHHGEQRYALEVDPSVDRDQWYWGIHKLVGSDPENPDHWQDMGNRGYTEQRRPGGLDHRFFGFEPSEEDENGDFDDTAGRANAMYAAEEAFQNHIGAAGSGLGGYDLGDVVRDHGDTKPRGHSLGDEDYGDIFGGKP